MINQSILKILLIDCKYVILIMPKDILFKHAAATIWK